MYPPPPRGWYDAARIRDGIRTLPQVLRQRLLRLRRSPSTRRAVVVRVAAIAVVLGAGAHVARSASTSESMRHRWESGADVVIARHVLQVGDRIAEDDIAVEHRPGVAVPDGALRELPAPLVATSEIAAGEPILEMRVGETTSGSASVPDGRAAVEIDLVTSVPSVGAGDRVDLLTAPVLTGPYPDALAPATDTPGPEEDGPGAQQVQPRPEAVVVARAAVVLGVADDERSSKGSMTVAVATEDVAATAAAVLAGPVAVVVRPPG